MAIRGWPSPLSWDQFEKRDGRPSDHPVDAHIEGAWRNPPGELMRPRRRRDGWRLENIILVVHLVPSETWVVSGAESDALLNHELGHWNILGLVVRELHQTLRRLRAPSPERLGERVEELSARLRAFMECRA